MRNDGLAKIELPFYQIKANQGSEYLKTKSQLLSAAVSDILLLCQRDCKLDCVSAYH